MKIKATDLIQAFRAFRSVGFFILFANLFDNIDASWFGGDSSTSYSNNYAKYGLSFSRDWLDNSKTIAIKVDGCVWGLVDDGEDMGCMEDESEDGTTMWYQMANCRRAQVAYSVYASSSGSTSCGKTDWKESMVTKYGVAEFAYTMGSYGYYSPISQDDVEDLPICEEDGNGYYYGVGCTSSGKFSLDVYLDQYCLQYSHTYQELSDLNKAMSNIGCYDCYNSNKDESEAYSLCAYLFPESGSCSAIDNPFCQTTEFVSDQGARSAAVLSSPLSGKISFVNKLKYAMGSVMLFASCAMFIGILFANRRKRRAMMHRKFRTSTRSKKRSSRSSKKTRSSQSREKHRTRDRDSGENELGPGVMT